MTKKKMVFNLKEIDGGKVGRANLPVTVEGNELALVIKPEGFGDYYSSDGHGAPILIENRNGVPFLIVWANINQEDPTHVINLREASEKARVEG